MTIIYRTSDSGYNKVKPEYINNLNCLQNAYVIFNTYKHKFKVIADNVGNFTKKVLEDHFGDIDYVSVGHGAGTFNLALDYALGEDDNEIIYFLENDYIHKGGSPEILQEAFDLGTDYATLYLHPDKFIPPHKGGNPNVENDGGYLTKIYRGSTQLFGLFDSTTMTFAAKVKTLKEDEEILRAYTTGTYPRDYEMFIALRQKGRSLLCPLETFSTHGETAWLAPVSGVAKEKLEKKWDEIRFPVMEYVV